MWVCHFSNIDASGALSLPGVVDVFTAEDIPGKKVRCFVGIDEEILALGEVGLHAGQCAAVDRAG